MNTPIFAKTGAEDFSRASPSRRSGQAEIALGTALWIFMGVATSLFALFIASYVMRMEASDWHQLAMPWQLWLSTLLLIGGSVLLQLASMAVQRMEWQRAHVLFFIGGISALIFLCVQLWAWQALLAAQVKLAGNPASSFFYLLTAMHGLHVTGGLLAWGMVARRAWQHQVSDAPLAWRIRLCARYWHFLLAVWLLLFAALGWLTPEVVQFICGPLYG